MSGKKKTAFQINQQDNVATALSPLDAGKVSLLGEALIKEAEVVEEIPLGHKLALCDIKNGEMIIKYGVPIGVATRQILKGSWVHLNCMRSGYDERSSRLDPVTGTPKDITYE